MLFNNKCCNRQRGFGMNIGNPCCDRPQMESPIMEPTITKCVEKEFYHEVPHCCPIHTHVVNKHIYNHTYTPQYTCSEENVVVNNDCGGCNNFQN
ncbi:MAG: CotD family spore coat protein [Clostridium sp.]|nr:CotD family spore coat protein [Clostridium sp.]MCM1444291.1 CotD family spore coat protein [Candidatus Amulumruptor caecigallinarius]